MNLQEFQEHASQNVVDYYKVVEYLVKELDEATQEIDTYDYRDREQVLALTGLIERLIKIYTHEPKKNHIK